MVLCNMKQEKEEINQWIDLYSEPLLKRALFLVGNREDAMDLVQDVFVSAASAYHAFEKRSSPLTWLQTILKNKIADFYRNEYRKPQTISMSSFFDQQTGSWTDDSVLNDWTQDFDESESRNILSETLERCLEYLPPQWLLTVKLYYMEEKKSSEVCRELDISSTNLWKILQRSRMQLRKCIELNWFNKL